MHIGVLGPMTLDMLPLRNDQIAALPAGYPSPIISSIVTGYLSRGMRVTAITTSIGIDRSRVFENGPLTLAVVPRATPRSALRMFRAERTEMSGMLATCRPDALHAHWTYEFAAAALDSGIPTLITVHDHAATVFRMKPDAYRFLRLVLNYSVLRRGRYFSAPSPYMTSRLSLRADRMIRTVHNFCGPETRSLVEHAGLGRQAIVTVSNGFSGRKNVGAAIEAFALSGASDRGWEYELIGQGLEPGGLANRWAASHGLESGLRFRGPLPYMETLSTICSSALMLHPALEESFGMTVLEAMVLGTPVIGGESAGNVPHLLAGGAGVLCDVRSPQAIAAGLELLIGDHEMAAHVASLARIRGEECFGREAALDCYIDYLACLSTNQWGADSSRPAVLCATPQETQEGV